MLTDTPIDVHTLARKHEHRFEVVHPYAYREYSGATDAADTPRLLHYPLHGDSSVRYDKTRNFVTADLESLSKRLHQRGPCRIVSLLVKLRATCDLLTFSPTHNYIHKFGMCIPQQTNVIISSVHNYWMARDNTVHYYRLAALISPRGFINWDNSTYNCSLFVIFSPYAGSFSQKITIALPYIQISIRDVKSKNIRERRHTSMPPITRYMTRAPCVHSSELKWRQAKCCIC